MQISAFKICPSCEAKCIISLQKYRKIHPGMEHANLVHQY